MLKANKSDSALPTGRKTEAELKVILLKKNGIKPTNAS